MTRTLCGWDTIYFPLVIAMTVTLFSYDVNSRQVRQLLESEGSTSISVASSGLIIYEQFGSLAPLM